MTTADEPAAPVHDDVFSKHIWAEAAATLTPVREDEAVAVADADLDADLDAEYDDEGEPEDEAPGAVRPRPTADEAEPGRETRTTRRPRRPRGRARRGHRWRSRTSSSRTWCDPDDGLREIITEPVWYLPGETDMTRGSPGVGLRSLIPQDDLVMPGRTAARRAGSGGRGPLGTGRGRQRLQRHGRVGLRRGERGGAAEPSWLGLAHEEGAAAAVEHEVSFEVAPSPSDDLFALPPLEEGVPENGSELGTPSPAGLDRWQDPLAPIAPLALGDGPVGITVAQHGPLERVDRPHRARRHGDRGDQALDLPRRRRRVVGADAEGGAAPARERLRHGRLTTAAP